MKKRNGIVRILYAAKYSLEGLCSVFKSEAAFRQDILLFAVLFASAFVLQLGAAERCALIIPLFILLIAEILNSAIEKCVDMFTSEFNPFAKFAKDAGSAAVFIALLCILTSWIVVLTAHFFNS